VHIISSDLFHLWEEHVPRHSRIYTDLIPIMEDVVSRYMADVRSRNYPGPKETVFMESEELMKFAKDMKWEKKLDEIGAQKKTREAGRSRRSHGPLNFTRIAQHAMFAASH
jgi:3-methyl-2-oxobutanoate hydroxymethyltransferase